MRSIGKESLDIGGVAAAKLGEIPLRAYKCQVSFEAGTGTSDTSKAARYWLDGNEPTNNEGHILSDNDLFEIEGREDIENARFIGVDAGASHRLEITYFALF